MFNLVSPRSLLRTKKNYKQRVTNNIKSRVSFLPFWGFSFKADFFCLSMVCFSSNSMSDKKTVTKMPGKAKPTNLN